MTLVAMKMNAHGSRHSVLGPEGWESFAGSAANPGLGVLVCTRVDRRNAGRGLRPGPDDGIGKPSHPEEVMARIEAVVRPAKACRTRRGRWPARSTAS